MGPVRVGNNAFRQTQNDSYGATVLAATQSFFDERLVDRRGRREFQWLEFLGHHAIETFDKPDAGLWEYRTRSQVHTYSSAMCWAACDRLARIANRLQLTREAAFWARKAARIHKIVLEKAWSSERQCLVAIFESNQVDASLLTLADIGFIAPNDPRFLQTIKVIEDELRHGPYLFRYTSEDDFGMPETAFNICTFWYINALAAVGRAEEARELFDNMLDRRSSQGLLSEDLNPETGELWGNFPQTYSMVGIIGSAMRLSRNWSDVL
jgi:pentatricopeptide repeat protein